MRVLVVDAAGSGRLIPLANALRRHGHGCALLDPSGAGAPGIRGLSLSEPIPVADATLEHLRSSTTAMRVGQNVVRAMHGRPAPDLVLGFAGEGSTLFVREVAPAAKVITIAPDHYVPLARERAPQPDAIQADASNARLVRRADMLPALMEILHADWTVAPRTSAISIRGCSATG